MNNTKAAYKEALKRRKSYYDNYIDLFKTLFCNSVKVEGTDVPKRYLFKTLLYRGGIAFHKETKLYLPYNGVGIDVYGLPTMYHLIGQNGFYIQCTPNEVVILRANDITYPVIRYFEQQAKRLVDIDTAIDQNIEAIKTMTIAEVSDNSQLQSIVNESECRRVGTLLVFKNKKSAVGSEIKTQSTGAEYMVDKLLEARRQILDETFSHIGISVANTDKRERVQGMEIAASQGLAKDCISTLIDTFNYDAKYGGIDIRLKANTSLMKENELDNKLKEKELKEEDNEDTASVND